LIGIEKQAMNLELLMLGDQPVAQLVERARLAEACGFDAVWIADERFYREAYSVLAQVASATDRIRLGPCVTDPFARHPALTAMAIATLDEISAGRAALGLGAGVGAVITALDVAAGELLLEHAQVSAMDMASTHFAARCEVTILETPSLTRSTFMDGTP